jgi:hypothetical protein
MAIKQYVSAITVSSGLIKPSDLKQNFYRHIKEL